MIDCKLSNPMDLDPSLYAVLSQLEIFPAPYGTHGVIAALATGCRLFLTSARSVHSTASQKI